MLKTEVSSCCEHSAGARDPAGSQQPPGCPEIGVGGQDKLHGTMAGWLFALCLFFFSR